MKNLKIRISKIDSIILRFFFVLFWIIAANLVVLYVFILFFFLHLPNLVFFCLSPSLFFFKYKMESKFKILICRIKCHTLFAFDDLFEIVLNYFSP